jgi:predicted nucleic acid-binding protein
MRRFLCDTNVLVYALGAPHPYREPCREIVARQGDGHLSGEVTAVVIAEFAHQRLRQVKDRQEATVAARQVGAAFRVHAVDEADTELALDLFARWPSLDAFDALLAATALNRGVDAVLSADRAFDAVEGIDRIDPLDDRAISALA